MLLLQFLICGFHLSCVTRKAGVVQSLLCAQPSLLSRLKSARTLKPEPHIV